MIIRIGPFEYRFDGLRYQWRVRGTVEWFDDPRTPEEFAALLRLAEAEQKGAVA